MCATLWRRKASRVGREDAALPADLLARLKRVGGSRGVIVLDAEGGDVLVVALWDSAQSARDGDSVLAFLLERYEPLAGTAVGPYAVTALGDVALAMSLLDP